MKRPELNEYNPYFQRYIDLVEDGNFFDLLKQNTNDTIRFFENIASEKHNYSYAENKWTVKAVLMHIIDTERVFSYRVLVAARGDNTTKIQTYDDDAYASNVDVTNRSMESLLEEFKVVRRSAEILFENLTDTQSKFMANAVNYNITPRALAYIMIGHIQHHLNTLKERYLNH